jgi:hypothetical protein
MTRDLSCRGDEGEMQLSEGSAWVLRARRGLCQAREVQASRDAFFDTTNIIWSNHSLVLSPVIEDQAM